MTNSQTPPGDGAVHIYIPSFAGGGAERFFVRLANQIASRDQTVHLIVNHDDGPLRGLLSDRVHLHVLDVSKATLAIPRLAAHIKSFKPSVLISALTRTNLAALLGARLANCGTRVIVCERNQYTALLGRLDPVRRLSMTFLVRWLYPNAHAVIGNTIEVTRDIASVARLAADKTGTIHNPAPEFAQIEAAKSEPVGHPWFDETRPIAVAIGRLVPQKDYPTMLRAMALCDPKLRLVILGDGPDRPELETLAEELGIADRVAFLGYRMDRFSYLVRADVFLMSSLTEGFPNALIEALAAGVPVISTDCAGGGPREILGQDFPDRLVPIADAEGFADTIRRVLDDRDAAAIAQDRDRVAQIAARYKISEIADAFLARAAV